VANENLHRHRRTSTSATCNSCIKLFYRVKYVCCSPRTQTTEKTSDICGNIHRGHGSLGGCTSDKDVYNSVFTRSDLSLGAEHVLEVIAHILCSYPPETVVESMGSVQEKIHQVCGGEHIYHCRPH